MPRAAASQAFWIAQRPFSLTYAGSVDFTSGQLVQFPYYNGEARQIFDDPASPGTVLLSTAHEETDYAQRFGLSTLAPGAMQWSLRGSVEQSIKGLPRVEAKPNAFMEGARL